MATTRAQIDVALYLLDHGADPNVGAAGFTPLHWASTSWEGYASNPVYGFPDPMSGIPDRQAKLRLVKALLAHGAKSVRACATHAVLSGPAVDRIEQSQIEEVIVTNSIPLREVADNSTRIKQLSVAPLLAKAIQSIHEDGSVSTLFV